MSIIEELRLAHGFAADPTYDRLLRLAIEEIEKLSLLARDARAEERARIFAAAVSACPCCCRVDSGHDEECTYADDCPEEYQRRADIIRAIRGQP